MQIKYRFSINGQSVTPIYRDDLTKEYTMESEQRFYRATLSGKLKFNLADYEWLYAQPFETEFVLLLEKSNDGGLTWGEPWTGKFYKTDGEWNEDDKIVEFKVDVKDAYSNVLAGLEKEYNLIKLAPAKTPLEIQKRPFIQVYVPGDSVIGCFIGGSYWEQEVSFVVDEGDPDLGNVYKFSTASVFYTLSMQGEDTPLIGDYVGEFVVSQVTDLISPTEEYFARPKDVGGGLVEMEIIRTSDSVVLYVSNTFSFGVDQTLIFNEVAGSRTMSGYRRTIAPRMRMLLDVDTFEGSPTFDIPSPDIVADNRNYKKVIPFGFWTGIDLLEISNKSSVTPTEYGLNDAGNYFAPPSGSTKYYPVARSSWGNSGFWLDASAWDEGVEVGATKAYISKETSPISSVISVLLAQFAPGITHDGTDEYSEFLYGGTNPVSGQAFNLLITQKSNILFGEFDRPASKAPITLDEVFRMLRDMLKAYWYIEDNKLKIEHISWFKNGGSYAVSPQYTADLTTLLEPRNKKPWGLYSSKYDFDRADMPERIEFKWMDSVAPGFEGSPIEINSKFVQEGKIDEINIGTFTTDIDYMLLNPSELNPEGFALFAAIEDDTNKFDPSDYVAGYFINDITGQPIAQGTAASTGLIAVSEGQTLTFSGYGDNFRVHTYSDNDFADHIANRGTVTTYIVEAGVKYLAFSLTLLDGGDYSSTFTIIRADKVLPFNSLIVDGADAILQNGILSWIYIHPRYWNYDLPANDVTINEATGTVNGIMRGKKQKVRYPSDSDPDPIKLIKTPLGDGEIHKLNVNLSSRMNDVTLKYDTE